MVILRAYKTELDLNNKQRTLCAKHAGTARFAYNWGLARCISAYKVGQKTPTAIDLHRELNALKKTELNWMYEVSKCAPQEALRNLDKAFLNFFRRVALKKAGTFTGKVGFPKFKSKRCGLGSFRLTGAIHVWDSHIQLPRLGRLRLKERGYLPSGAKFLSATGSEHAGHWFVSVQVEEKVDIVKSQGLPDVGLSPTRKPKASVSEANITTIGVDLGIKKMAVCSDGKEFENPCRRRRRTDASHPALRNTLRKLRRAQRELSRRQKGGKNREKSRRRVARLHYRIANIRKDAIHKATSLILRKLRTAKTKPQDRPSVVVIEDLSVENMLKNHKLARAISDLGFFECLVFFIIDYEKNKKSFGGN
jgi:putative transposase